MLLLMLHLELHLILTLPDWLEPCAAKLIPRACGSLIYGMLTVLEHGAKNTEEELSQAQTSSRPCHQPNLFSYLFLVIITPLQSQNPLFCHLSVIALVILGHELDQKSQLISEVRQAAAGTSALS